MTAVLRRLGKGGERGEGGGGKGEGGITTVEKNLLSNSIPDHFEH